MRFQDRGTDQAPREHAARLTRGPPRMCQGGAKISNSYDQLDAHRPTTPPTPAAAAVRIHTRWGAGRVTWRAFRGGEVTGCRGGEGSLSNGCFWPLRNQGGEWRNQMDVIPEMTTTVFKNCIYVLFCTTKSIIRIDAISVLTFDQGQILVVLPESQISPGCEPF